MLFTPAKMVLLRNPISVAPTHGRAHHWTTLYEGSMNDGKNNPLLTAQQRFLNSLSPTERTHFFSSTHVTPERRAEIWEEQADLGETLVNSYAWATPDPRLIKVFQHFAPIVEVGCGANAYWSRWMNAVGGVDVIALDASLDDGGKLSSEDRKRMPKTDNNYSNSKAHKLVILHGGPASLSEDAKIRDSDRTLFLCYPDEDCQQQDDNEDDECKEDADPPVSMAAMCLEHYTGSTVIHVGELFGDTLNLEQAPFGRSSSSEFQQRLAAEYHCILRMKLESNWLHVRDTLSVWKRSETCCIAFEKDDNDGEDDDDEEMYYKYIPPNELLPVDLAAQCVAHLLGDIDKEKGEAVVKRKADDNTAQRVKRKKGNDKPVIAGNAW